MNQNAASAQGGTLHEEVGWSAFSSVTPVTGQFPEQCKQIAKGKLTLNNTGWAWTYPERTALWQPYSKNHQLHPLQVKQKQNSTVISYPDLLKQRNMLQLCWKLLVPAENRGICHPNNRGVDSQLPPALVPHWPWRQESLATAPTRSKLDQCMLWPLDVSKKDACSAVLDVARNITASKLY